MSRRNPELAAMLGLPLDTEFKEPGEAPSPEQAMKAAKQRERTERALANRQEKVARKALWESRMALYARCRQERAEMEARHVKERAEIDARFQAERAEMEARHANELAALGQK